MAQLYESALRSGGVSQQKPKKNSVGVRVLWPRWFLSTKQINSPEILSLGLALRR